MMRYSTRAAQPGAEIDFGLLWLALGLLGLGLVMVYSASLAIAEAARYTGHNGEYYLIRQGIFIGIGVAAAINLFLGLSLVPRMGISGAALAKVVAYAVLAVVMWAVSQRLYRVPYDLAKFVLLMVTGVAFFWLSRLTPQHLGVGPVMARVALVGAFPLLLLLGGYVERQTVARLLSTVVTSVLGAFRAKGAGR